MDLSKVNLLIGIGGAQLVMLTIGLAAPAHADPDSDITAHANLRDATFGATSPRCWFDAEWATFLTKPSHPRRKSSQFRVVRGVEADLVPARSGRGG